MLAFFWFLFWQYDICPYVSRVSQTAHRVILISLHFLFYSVFISFFRALLFMLTGFSVTFLLTTPKSIFQYLLTQCWLSLCCVIFLTFRFGMDVIKLSQVECRQEWIVARRAVSVLLSIYISYLPMTLIGACKVLHALLYDLYLIWIYRYYCFIMEALIAIKCYMRWSIIIPNRALQYNSCNQISAVRQLE